MKINILLSALTVLSIIACGPSQQEIKEREEFVADSLKQEQFIADSLKLAEENDRIHLEKIEVGKTKKKNWLSGRLKIVENQLDQAEQKYNSIDEFEFGRSTSTKEKQLNEQTQIIEELEGIMKAINTEIANAELFQSFDFQNSPKGTINHLFEAAKNRNFSKLRHLIDPYGDANNDAFEICMYEILNLEIKIKWIEAFEFGRIIGEPEIKEDKAIVEIAIGSQSNRLKKIGLINRNGFWYLIGT